MIVAAVTAVLVAVSGAGLWFLIRALGESSDGTYADLRDAGDAGAWHAVEPTRLAEDAAVRPGVPLRLDADREVSSSWFVQVAASATGEEAELLVGGVPIAVVPADGTISLSVLVALDDAGAAHIEATAPITVTVDAFAWLTDPDERPGPPAEELELSTDSPAGEAAPTGVPVPTAAPTTTDVPTPTVAPVPTGSSVPTPAPMANDPAPATTPSPVPSLTATESAPPRDRPGPGGSIAVAPRLLVDTTARLGATTARGPVTVSPQGLGGVPSERVAAVWLQVAIRGDGATVGLADESGESTPVLIAAGDRASGLVLAPLDDDGLVTLVPDRVDELRVAVVGWSAAPERDVDASIIEGGILAGSAAVDWQLQRGSLGAALPEAVPTDAVAVWSLALDAHDADAVIGETDEWSTAVPVAGDASALLAAPATIHVGTADVMGVGFLGFLIGPSAGAPPTIEITAPTADGQVDLVDTGGIVTFAGTVEPGGAAVRRVDVRVGDRFIGTAEVRLRGGELHWSLDAVPQAGPATIEAVVTDVAGREGRAEVAFEVPRPPADATIVRPETVVLTAAQRAAIISTTAGWVVLRGESPVRVGDIMTSDVAPGAPSGVFARVEAVETRGDRTTVRLGATTLDQVFAQVDVAVVDQPVDLGGAPVAPVTAAGGGGPGALQAMRAALPTDIVGPRPRAASAPPALAAPGALCTGSGEGELALPALGVDIELSASLDGVPGGTSNSASPADVSIAGKGRLSIGDHTAIEVSQAFDSADDVDDPDDGRTDSASVTSNLKLKLQQSYVMMFTWILKIGFNWDGWNSRFVVDHFKSSVTFCKNESITVSAKVAVELSDEIPALKRMTEWLTRRVRTILGTQTIMAGPVPIVLSQEVAAKATFEVSVEVGDFTFSHAESLEVGIEYVGGNWRGISERRDDRYPNPGGAWVQVETTLGIGIELRLEAWQVIDLVFSAVGELTTTLKYTNASVDSAATGSLKITAVGKLTAGVALGVEEIGLELKYEREMRTPEAVLFEDEVTWGVPLAGGDPAAPATDPGASTGSGERPVVLVVDVSGSMAGARISEAQGAMKQVVENQPAGSALGIWTYPTGGSCSPGGFRVPVQSFTTTSAALQVIDSLATGGNTPTGEALQAVISELRTAGYPGASIVLLTDGEANCGVDACTVATDARSSGFDVTVHSVAYQIAGTGRDQLDCITAATGGTTVDVDNPDELEPVIDELSKARIELSIELPELVRPGKASTFAVTVRNAGAHDITDVKVKVDADAGSASAVVGPTMLASVGNVPTGAEVVLRLQLTPTAVRDGTVDVAVTAWGTNSDLAAASRSVESAREAEIEPGPVFAPDADDTLLVGDGFAVPPDWGVDGSRADDCRPQRAAGPDLAEAIVVACPGATSANVLDRGQLGGPSAVADAPQIAAVPAGERFGSAIVAVGAEDIGLGTLLARCTTDECRLSDPDVQTAILGAQLLDVSPLLHALGSRAGEVIVPAYPWLFPAIGTGVCTAYSPEEVDLFNTIVGFLNASNEDAVARAAAMGADVRFVAATADALRPDRTLCATTPGVELIDGAAALTADGTGPVADQLLLWSRSSESTTDLDVDEDADAASSIRAESHPAAPMTVVDVLGAGIQPVVTLQLDASRDAVWLPESLAAVALQPGQAFRIVGSGYRPGAIALASLSRDVDALVATGAVAADGTVVLEGVVPRDIVAGTARLTVMSVAAGGLAVQPSARVAITQPAPLWVALTAVGTAVLLLAGIVLVGVGMLRRRRA